MRENEIEKAFVDAVKEAGGKAVKFTSQTMNGVPDNSCGGCKENGGSSYWHLVSLCSAWTGRNRYSRSWKRLGSGNRENRSQQE